MIGENEPKPRSSGVRVAAVVAALAVIFAADVPSSLASPVHAGFLAIPLVVVVAWCVFIYKCAPLVSYRSRDAFMILIPLWGIVWLTSIVVWRLMFLPYRDWSPRPEEATGWQQVLDPLSPGRLIYRLR